MHEQRRTDDQRSIRQAFSRLHRARRRERSASLTFPASSASQNWMSHAGPGPRAYGLTNVVPVPAALTTRRDGEGSNAGEQRVSTGASIPVILALVVARNTSTLRLAVCHGLWVSSASPCWWTLGVAALAFGPAGWR